MKVLILCGGRGTRLNGDRPKPLIEIGGRPIVWHVMSIYAAQGFRDFVLLTGFKGDEVAAWAANAEWSVECVDTGVDTPTGGRVDTVRDRLDSRFCLTYADGVADIDLGELVDHHDASGALATMTVVRPELQFGVAQIDDSDPARPRVTGFREKPRAEQWVNGGFLCFEPGVVEYLAEDSVLEREPLERLAAAGQLHAYRHEGFWDCMDTYKDAVLLNDLCHQGLAPWARPRDARTHAAAGASGARR
jgi:glucose-1-phosphate cytidylyltransferase